MINHILVGTIINLQQITAVLQMLLIEMTEKQHLQVDMGIMFQVQLITVSSMAIIIKLLRKTK
nr:MAG TPA: hypothetical protein [Caudoviricetes sp.]